ncbi:MAG TPA: S1 family peptidase [Polyangium sp.]|nr:S1 family peptidase [Polyangium sp.]
MSRFFFWFVSGSDDWNPPTMRTREAIASVLNRREPRSSPPSSLGARLSSGLPWATVFVSTSLLVGCGQATKRPIATPASQGQAEERPFVFQPPVDLDIENKVNAVVRIVGDVTCTGTLIAEDLVLTAHHCVSERDADGTVHNRDKDPESLTIELGGDDLPWGEVKVRAIVSPDCGYVSGEGDIAILVLSRKLVGVPTLSPRIEEAPTQNEAIYPIGFGRCALSRGPIHRIERVGGPIGKVRSGDFFAVASVCPGDSGGPAYSASRQDVVGVVSASVMDGDDATAAPSIFVRLDAWRELFSAAKEIANGTSPSELPPFRSCQR